jgi:hypothetical protein
VLVRFDHIARFIVNANHSVMWTAAMLRVADCVVDRIRFAVPQPTEWQRIGNQIDAAMVFARSDFASVQHPVSAIEPSSTTSKTNCIVIFISGNFGLTCGKRLHRESCAESFGI